MQKSVRPCPALRSGFFSSGGCSGRRGFDFLLEAAQQVRSSSSTPFVVEIVGDGPS